MMALNPSQVLGCGTTAQSSSSLFFPLMKAQLEGTPYGHISLGSTEHVAESDSATQPHTTQSHRAVLGKSHAHHILDQQHINGSIFISKTPKVTLGTAVVMERHRESRRASRDLGQPDGHGTARALPGSFSVTTFARNRLPLSWEQ